MRVFLRFFFSPSAPPDGADLDAVFFAAFSALAGALDAVDAGAFPAVDAGLGAIADVCGWWLGGWGTRCGGRGQRWEETETTGGRVIYRRDAFVLVCARTRSFVDAHQQKSTSACT